MRGVGKQKISPLSLSVHLMLAHTRDHYRKKYRWFGGREVKVDLQAHTSGPHKRKPHYLLSVRTYVVTCFGLLHIRGTGRPPKVYQCVAFTVHRLTRPTPKFPGSSFIENYKKITRPAECPRPYTIHFRPVTSPIPNYFGDVKLNLTDTTDTCA